MRTKASVNQKIIPESQFYKWLKPFNLPVRAIFKNEKSEEASIEFYDNPEMLIEDASRLSEDYFLDDCGYVLRHEIINNKQTLNVLRTAFQKLKTDGIETCEPINYADQSNAAKLARHILRNDPYMNSKRFVIEARTTGDIMGYSESDINECISNFSTI